MGNQQERPILSLEFLAGLIVGEGSYCLVIARSKKRDTIDIRPMFSLRMNDVETIDRVCESFAAHGLALYRNPNTYKRCVSISTTGILRMQVHLEAFLPLLTGKKLEAAQVVAEFIERRLRTVDGLSPPYDEQDIALIERLREINGPSAVRVPIGILRDYTKRPVGGKSRRRVRDSPVSRESVRVPQK